MQLPIIDQEVLKSAYAFLHDAIGNITCLYNFISCHFPEHKDIEYTLYIHAIHRAKEIEGILSIPIDYPVFGKEIDMGSREKIYALVKNNLNLDHIGYLDLLHELDMSNTSQCVDTSLHLYRIDI